MDTQSISSILSAASSSTTDTTTTSSVLGKDEFLELLIAELQNQDPLEPMNNQEYVAQMAQFSSLEQLQNLNATLADNVNYTMLLSQTISNTMATSLIGKEITAECDTVGITSGSDANITFATADYAASGTITVSDADGTVVRTLHVDNLLSGDHSICWDGKDEYGNDVASGEYSYTVSLTDANGSSVTASTYRNSALIAKIKYVSGQAT